MLCFANGTGLEGSGVALTGRSAGGAPAASGRTARADRDPRPNLGEAEQLLPSDLCRSETFVTKLSLAVAFMYEGLTFELSGAVRRPLERRVRRHRAQPP